MVRIDHIANINFIFILQPALIAINYKFLSLTAQDITTE